MGEKKTNFFSLRNYRCSLSRGKAVTTKKETHDAGGFFWASFASARKILFFLAPPFFSFFLEAWGFLSLRKGLSGRKNRKKKHDSYLVDPASSHMLVSKIKPCMSKYKQLVL